jgi:transposase
MPHARTRSGGLEVHTAALAVAAVPTAPEAEVLARGPLGTRQGDLARLGRTRHATAQHLALADAAGPCGDGRSRSCTPTGHRCGVVAPSFRPQTAGARVNTDRRAARPLARLRRSGALTPVEGPKVEEEASRDPTRAREEALRALQAAPRRRRASLRRHARRDTGGAPWGPAPRRWLPASGRPTPAPPIVVQAEGHALTAPPERRQRLEPARPEQVSSWRLPPVIAALPARRGVPFTGAVTAVAALGELTRVDQPRHLLPGLGLLPSPDARGERRRQGAMTTAGKPPARRAWGEGAWASRDPAPVRRP